MSDPLLTLAVLNGKELALTQAKTLVDQAALAIAALQSANATEKAPVVASLQGVSNIRATSSVDDYCLNERTIGQGAAIDYIQANPACTEDEAVAAWLTAVQAAVPVVTHAPHGLLALYTQNTVQMGKITEATWAAFRDFVVATPKSALMGM